MPAKKKPVKKGYHRMPDGSLMKNSMHERSEGKREREREYGKNGKNGKPTIVIAISMGKPRKSAPKKGKSRGR